MASETAPLYSYLRDRKIESTGDGYVTKTANSRDLIATLPNPTNMKRNIDRVPDVTVHFTLSTRNALPDFVQQKINTCSDSPVGDKYTVAGLLISGQSPSIKIFLHEYFMQHVDGTGHFFDDVTLHEMAHGLEGIRKNKDGQTVRDVPWSYKLQQNMLKLDAEQNHHPDLSSKPHLKYLRKGTKLQANVSEIFARTAVVFMLEIKKSGQAPDPKTNPLWMMPEIEEETDPRKKENVSDLRKVFQTFSKRAQKLFIAESENMFDQITQLYGCEPEV